ncbi:MAG: CIA30 family protein [Spirochaetales bacterium]|nr:CIA30 family protein [Spirochaetales bacterium]
MKRIAFQSLALLCIFAFLGCGTTAPQAQPSADTSAAQAAEVKLVENCEGGGVGGAWSTYSDANADNGDSTSLPEPFVLQSDGRGANGSQGYAAFYGTVTKKCPYGFSGLTYDFNRDKKTAMDISGYTGFSFWMRGDGNFYNFAVKSPAVVTDFAYYEFGIRTTKEWKEYKVPFTKFSQESWGKSKNLTECLKNATGFQVQTIGQPIAKFEAQIDEIALYK